MNFIPQGERGHSAFLPILESSDSGQTLAEWMTVPTEAITVEPEQSANIPVNIAVPADASPGGHYAAVMVGTRPPDTDGAVAVTTSQLISSLFFLRIAGDVVEDASIRTFRWQNSKLQFATLKVGKLTRSSPSRLTKALCSLRNLPSPDTLNIWPVLSM